MFNIAGLQKLLLESQRDGSFYFAGTQPPIERRDQNHRNVDVRENVDFHFPERDRSKDDHDHAKGEDGERILKGRAGQHVVSRQ